MDPELVLRRYYEAMNAGDVDSALALFADDAIRMDSATPHLAVTGKTQIKTGLVARIADRIYIVADGYQVNENVVNCMARVSTGYGRRLGFAPVEEAVEVIVEAGFIKRFVVTVTPESLARIHAVEASHRAET